MQKDIHWCAVIEIGQQWWEVPMAMYVSID